MKRIKKDDRVMVIAGKEKGQIGTVMKVVKDGEKVLVAKLNMVKRHTKPNQQNAQGGIIEKEAPLHISNVMLVGDDDRPVRVGYRVDGDKGKIRFGRQTNKAI